MCGAPVVLEFILSIIPSDMTRLRSVVNVNFRKYHFAMRPGLCWRNIRWVRRYACRCETLVAMAFASSFYLYIKWREEKTASPPAAESSHRLQNTLQYTKLTSLWQRYSRLFAATATVGVPIATVPENNEKAPPDIAKELHKPVEDENSNISSAQWFEKSFLSQADDDNSEYGPWSYKRDNIAVYALQGRRPSMEDRFCIVDDESSGDARFVGFAVYDGHGGPFLANYAERHILPSIIRSFLSNSNDGKPAMNLSQLISDEIIRNDEIAMRLGGLGQDLSGSTALLGVVHKNKLYIANVGDSRAVATKVGTIDEALQITMDHKPNEEGELERIKAAGGWVAFNGVWRVGGILAVSRALGDAYLKKFGWLTAKPDIFVIDLKRLPLRYIIMASDGLWDVFSSQEAVDFVSPYIDKEHLFGAKQLAEKAVKKGSTDNVTVMIVKLANATSSR